MDQMLLTTGIIIIYVLYPIIVFDKFLLNSFIYLFIYLFIYKWLWHTYLHYIAKLY